MRNRGFTLMELLVVVVLIGILAAVSAPVVSRSVQQSRESALREDLQVLRKAIDDYYGDTGRYPATLQVLVEARYLRAIPADPLAPEGREWTVEKTRDGKGVTDVHSAAQGQAADGSAYSSW